MIHGIFTGGWCWDNYKTFFEKRGYICVTPTLRLHNFGSKSKPNPELGHTSILDYVSDLEKEIKKINTLPIIIGHSMGGLIAQIIASKGLSQATIL